MPFTPAHPALVLPLISRKQPLLSSTGLIIGSMAPDFEYFFRLHHVSYFSHTIIGVFLFNVPITFLLSVIFHVLVRDQVIRHLPPYFRQRALTVRYPEWLTYLEKNWFLFLISAVIGAFSHLLWDEFTHPDNYIVTILPILLTQVKLPVIEKSIMLCRLIQHLSSVLGIAVVLWYVYRLPKAQLQPGQQQHWFRFWLGIFGFGVLFVLLNLFIRLDLLPAPGNLVVILISGCMLALIIAGATSKLKQQI